MHVPILFFWSQDGFAGLCTVVRCTKSGPSRLHVTETADTDDAIEILQAHRHVMVMLRWMA
jgi:hypothetical protein